MSITVFPSMNQDDKTFLKKYIASVVKGTGKVNSPKDYFGKLNIYEHVLLIGKRIMRHSNLYYHLNHLHT
jgi:hypothetical protein